MRVRSAGAVLLVIAGLVACGEESADESAGAAAGEAVARSAEGGAASPADEAGSEPGSSGESEGSGGSDEPPAASPSSECPADDAPPAVPDESPPPTMAGDMEPGEIPNGLGGETVPQFGELIVDVPANGCIDIPTSLRADQRMLVYTHADDEKYTHIEMFGPNGQRLADWHTGDPGTSEGWDFYNDTPIPSDGVYVFRVTHERGSDDPFVISFYGQP
jgi:hypothetical protein